MTYTTKTFYKNGKRVSWPELYRLGEFKGLIVKGTPHYGHNENGNFVERMGSDCICTSPTPEKIVTPKILNRYDETGKWVGYALDPAQVQVRISHYASEADACSGQNQVGTGIVEEYKFSVRQGSLHKETSVYGYITSQGHVIHVSPLPGRERD